MSANPVRCPICLDLFVWTSNEELFEFRGGSAEPLLVPGGVDEVKRADILSTAFLRCPNPSGDAAEHFLPLAYTSYLPPMVIGLVGSSRTGKSHLLAAMIAEISRGGLQPYGITFAPVDHALHAGFQREKSERLVAQNRRLAGTVEKAVSYADALLITSAAGTRPVAFFDVAGGDLLERGVTGRFLVGAAGLIFVVDPGTALGLSSDDDPLPAERGSDPAFDSVLARLGAGRSFMGMPVALVVNKADRLRLRPPADQWLRARSDGTIDAARWRAESRDAYALLYQHGAHAWLRPFHESQRCTIHFASATGSEAHGDTFARPVRPTRVLEPLLALLAMAGALPGSEAARVGRP